MSDNRIVPPAKAGEESVDIRALARQVEQLMAPSREIDCAIFKFLNPKYSSPNWRIYLDGLRHDGDGSDIRTPPYPKLPYYTRSFEAAMTLVPKRFAGNWDMRLRNNDAYRVELYEPSHEIQGRGRSLACALLAASLRAISETLSSSQSEGT